MKNLSAKLQLTVWTSLLMSAMAIIVIVLLFSFSDTIIETNSKSQLMKVVLKNADELEWDDRKLDTDDIDFYKNGVTTLIYSETGTILFGSFPDDQNQNIPLKDKETTEITINETTYYVYDVLSSVEDSRQKLWVRGVISVNEVAETIRPLLLLSLFILPAFIIVGTAGCYIIVKLTFRPLDTIIKTAEEISTNEDLTLRINLENSSAEIQQLANTFDSMLNKLEESFEAEKQFSQNVSHELRTPTAVILAQCEYALGEKVQEHDKQEALEVVNKQAKKMAKLISELLGLLRFERGIEKAEFSQINLSELVLLVCEEQSVLNEKNINLTHSIEPNIILKANQTMLIRLVSNLLSNAYRYGKENGCINVVLSEEDNNIRLLIEDDGIGIADENIEKIWQRFYQVDASRSTDSMGLGLAMVHQIAKLHNAKIDVKSELEKGSIFTIHF